MKPIQPTIEQIVDDTCRKIAAERRRNFERLIRVFLDGECFETPSGEFIEQERISNAEGEQ